ncbi:MAG: DUF4396 domain-containing protein [Hyphomicrobium sp.]|nr:DUF4396 domain-containing protein [Hyphomicrobium sp.]
MLVAVMMIWFTLTAASVLYVALDIQHTPANPVLKWGFILLTAYFGPIGLALYVFGCRKHDPEEHARFVAAPWRQVLGSTMHCVAGDGIGILAGAVIAAAVSLSVFTEVALEYVLGFAFGWTIFQALFMRDMFGGSYSLSLKNTFISELLSMNCLMGGMIPVSVLAWRAVPEAHDPTHGLFWFRMSIALLVGFIVAYPMNWWLVTNHLKHGMITALPPGAASSKGKGPPRKSGGMKMGPRVPKEKIWIAAGVSFAVLGLGLLMAFAGRG